MRSTKENPFAPSGMATVRLSMLLLAFLLLVFSGCGDGRDWQPVNGNIEFKEDGSAASFGTIEFRSESEPVVIARGKIEKDGSFSVSASGKTGTVGGWHTVVILMPVRNLVGGKTHQHGLQAAQKYQDHRTTDLRVEITKDSAKDLLLEIDEISK